MRYLTERGISETWSELTARDRAVTETLAALRLASGGQLRRLHFPGANKASAARVARRTLARLVERRVLARLPRRVGGVRAGSDGFVYTLDLAGQRGASRRRRPRSVSAPFTDHALAVAELYVRLHEADRDEAVELLSIKTEPDCWETFTTTAGQRWVKPDLAVSLGAGEFADHWFIEVDRGTETAPTVLRKARAFADYWQGGTRDPFPRVLITVPDETRRAFVADALSRLPADAWPLFRVVPFEDALATLTVE